MLQGKTGHQYLTEEGRDDAIIEISLGEVHPGVESLDPQRSSGDCRLDLSDMALGATALGDLAYGYDPSGHRTSVGGSLARVTLPAVLSILLPASNAGYGKLYTATVDSTGQVISRVRQSIQFGPSGAGSVLDGH